MYHSRRSPGPHTARGARAPRATARELISSFLSRVFLILCLSREACDLA